ncbi:hypothetical protein CSA80_04800 [Candidatus Saccharibacteria bacterium]|nr:MAG: hypothetical protein CSA80_04800 [Candidatus Saccharibacteria bacterium]
MRCISSQGIAIAMDRQPHYIETVQSIVRSAKELHLAMTNQGEVSVNYACIFAQNKEEFDTFEAALQSSGKVIQKTKSGPVFAVPPFPTAAGPLKIVKIRRPDPSRPERGDADFTLLNYSEFKDAHLGHPGWKLIERPDMEMLELAHPRYDVLVYYSHPTLAEVLGVKP